MKLASRKRGRDGELLAVASDLQTAASAAAIAPTMQAALDDWDACAPRLAELCAALNAGRAGGAFPFSEQDAASPLPRAYQFADGSAYLRHVELVRRARGAELPESFLSDPLMYQGGGDCNLAPRDPIPLADEEWGLDFEGEVAAIVGDVPAGVPAAEAADYIRLLVLANDISLRNLIPAELAKGFGFFQSKPPSAFSPAAASPDELGGAWRGGKVHLPLDVFLNGESFGRADAGADMQFGFAELIAHAAKTRPLGAGAIIGAGTVSNRDPAVGESCVAERRMKEKIGGGEIKTRFLRAGDTVKIEMRDGNGASIFGAIEQTVAKSR